MESAFYNPEASIFQAISQAYKCLFCKETCQGKKKFHVTCLQVIVMVSRKSATQGDDVDQLATYSEFEDHCSNLNNGLDKRGSRK